MSPRTGALSFSYIFTARRVSASDTRCGVVTTTAPGHGHRLAQAERHVAGARRHVDDQVVQLGPAHVAEELRDDAVQHRPAPDHRRLVVGEEAHRHGGEAVLLRRHDLLAVVNELSPDTEHDRHVGPVDVAVDDADAAAQLRQRDRQVDGDGRLADAALAGADGDDVADAGDRRAAALGQRRRPHHGRHLDVDGRDAGDAANGGGGLFAELLLDRTGRRGELDRDADGAAVDGDALHEAEADDVLVEIGILDDAKRVEDGGLRHRRRTGEHPAIVPCRALTRARSARPASRPPRRCRAA